MNRCNIDFGGVPLLLIGDFCQLPPVKQKTIFSSLTPTDVWFEFKFHELTEIVRQSSDLHFAQLLNRLHEGKHTQKDIEKHYTILIQQTGLLITQSFILPML